MKSKLPEIDYSKLDQSELERTNNAIKFRGHFIEEMITIERYLEKCIIKFFVRYNTKKDKKLPFFIDWWFLKQREITVSFKMEILKNMIFLELFKSDIYNQYFDLMNKLIRLRNYVAHNPIAFDFKEGISYYKLTHNYKNIPDSIISVLTGEVDEIRLTLKTQKELSFQAYIVGEFFSFISDTFETDETKRKYIYPNDRLTEIYKYIDISLLTNGGVFTIFRDKDNNSINGNKGDKGRAERKKEKSEENEKKRQANDKRKMGHKPHIPKK